MHIATFKFSSVPFERRGISFSISIGKTSEPTLFSGMTISGDSTNFKGQLLSLGDGMYSVESNAPLEIVRNGEVYDLYILAGDKGVHLLSNKEAITLEQTSEKVFSKENVVKRFEMKNGELSNRDVYTTKHTFSSGGGFSMSYSSSASAAAPPHSMGYSSSAAAPQPQDLKHDDDEKQSPESLCGASHTKVKPSISILATGIKVTTESGKMVFMNSSDVREQLTSVPGGSVVGGVICIQNKMYRREDILKAAEELASAAIGSSMGR